MIWGSYQGKSRFSQAGNGDVFTVDNLLWNASRKHLKPSLAICRENALGWPPSRLTKIETLRSSRFMHAVGCQRIRLSRTWGPTQVRPFSGTYARPGPSSQRKYHWSIGNVWPNSFLTWGSCHAVCAHLPSRWEYVKQKVLKGVCI